MTGDECKACGNGPPEHDPACTVMHEARIREERDHYRDRAHSAEMAMSRLGQLDNLRALLDRDLETMRDLEDAGSEGHSEGGCVWCWSTGEHSPKECYPIEHLFGCPIKVAIDRLVQAGAVDRG